ncbi:MAG: hypothetical protein JJD98_06260 [Polaromonas sp.]|nr:hypothetical protein [Polaromonas sp.]
MSWTRLLKRVFQIDLEHCPNCGGERGHLEGARDRTHPHAPRTAGPYRSTHARWRHAIDLADDRVQCNRAGQVVLRLKTPWRVGTMLLVVSPLEFIQRLAAPVPG